MTSSGTVRLSSIFEMLNHCAKGYERKESKHYNIITYREKAYRNFPKGYHGEKNPEIEKGHVRKLIRFLGIDEDCARKHLPLLR